MSARDTTSTDSAADSSAESDRAASLAAAVPPLSRRRLLASAALGGALGAWSTLSFAGSAGAGGNRFVFVILRGGMDGLGAAPAVGDPDFAAARGPLSKPSEVANSGERSMLSLKIRSNSALSRPSGLDASACAAPGAARSPAKTAAAVAEPMKLRRSMSCPPP